MSMMVQCQVGAAPSIAVTMELDGGIRNPACQDDLDETCYSKERSCSQPNYLPTNKSTEILTIQCADNRLEGAGVGSTVDPSGASAGSQDAREKIMNACRSLWHWRFLVDGTIGLSVVVFLGVIELGILPHQQIGFYCNDPRLSFKFTGDTISMPILLGGSVVLPLIVMWTTEWTYHKSDSYGSLQPGCAGSRGKQIWAWYGHYTIGIVAVTCFCDFAKILIGAPRPHFFDTCNPYELDNCTDTYIASYTCRNTEQPFWFIMDASKSFPSGHSALSVFTSVYLIWYIKNRLPQRTTSMLLKPWLQCLIVCWGFVCSLTRIMDNRHHWWDVLAGVIFGIFTAIYCVKVNCNGFIAKNMDVGWAHGEPVENGHHGYDNRRHQSVRKLLSNTSVENREMGDIVTM
ncbi:phospholipid phosphatase 3-like isoform X2 [Athalia rosae]|uniref:phospholipid phosphatase 3-like isoform X2 n=1 Tax=Athalia rosae TaxID=37344 RepID=UPI002033858B|nr:phospholipid phosphatase 3-like isoform X2 [Athalia rosae]XP_020711803.2 phospholipid phosphatase 3-like isoform X2 [Athalia rosae]